VGHEEAVVKYVPQELMDQWALKDPVENRAISKKKIIS
jgi:hypothetical protein